MMRRRLVTVATVIVILCGSWLSLTAAATPSTASESVIVRLRTQPDLSGIHGSRAERLREVIHRAETTAQKEQLPFLKLIAAWQKAGLVTDYQPFWVFDGFAVTAAPEVITALAHNPEVATISPDLAMSAPASSTPGGSPEWNVSLVNAPALWNLGFTGQGVVVATLDTGVEISHPDLAARWRGGANSWYDPFGQHPTQPTDRSGHGTQVTGVIVGGDAGGTSIGVAPGAKWIAARIYNDKGQGTASKTHLAFQWLLDPDHDSATADAPQVVNNSWTYGSGCSLEFAQDVQMLRSAGILPLFAAGNSPSITASPANNPGAFAIGATTSADTIASFSSLGPSACGEPPTTFPELTAPGASVRTADLNGGYATQDGTSLAAPHVAGALALLLSAYPDLSPSQQESALEGGAKDLGAAGADNTFGFGRLDVLGAYDAARAPDFGLDVGPSSALTTAGGSVGFSIAATALNGFGGDVALSVTGLPASATASLSPSVLAGGSGTSQLTVSTSSSVGIGTYLLSVTGTSGALSHSSTVALVVSAPPDFSITANPSAATATAGKGAAYTVTVSSLNGFADPVGLALGGLTSAQASWSFTPTTVATGSGTSQLAIVTAATLAPGSYPLTITGTSGPIARTSYVTLVVSQPDFTLTAAPATLTVKRNGQASTSVSIASIAGFSSAVTLSVSALPTGVTGSFSNNPVAPGGQATLTLKAAKQARASTFTLTIAGTGGGRTHAVTATVTVT